MLRLFVLIFKILRIVSFVFVFSEKPLVMSGIRELRVLKTTQSAFTNFYNDEYRTLPDADDRILSTVVRCDWWYSSTDNVNFDKAW